MFKTVEQYEQEIIDLKAENAKYRGMLGIVDIVKFQEDAIQFNEKYLSDAKFRAEIDLLECGD
jgi:hypothetical protein